MSWLRARKETTRSGLKIERRRLEPLIAIRGTAGLALVIGVGLAFFGPVVAAGSAFDAFQEFPQGLDGSTAGSAGAGRAGRN
ncbi:hypothetical protein ACWCP8_33075 [Streptomyces sp. NPDC002206]